MNYAPLRANAELLQDKPSQFKREFPTPLCYYEVQRILSEMEFGKTACQTVIADVARWFERKAIKVVPDGIGWLIG